MKDKVLFFIIKWTLIPIVFMVILVFAVREEIENRRCDDDGSRKPDESNMP